MTIDLSLHIRHGAALPLAPVYTYTGSALPLDIAGIPSSLAGEDVTGVTVSVTNADGISVSATAEKTGNAWRVLFAPSNFDTYGVVAKGVRISASTAAGAVVVATADLVIKAASPSATPGDPTKSYVTKGSDIYLKSFVDGEGAQHYVRQTMQFDARVGWGAVWTGDYILVNGDFMEVNQ